MPCIRQIDGMIFFSQNGTCLEFLPQSMQNDICVFSHLNQAKRIPHAVLDLLSTVFSLTLINSGTLFSNRFISSENSILARFDFPPTTTVVPSCSAHN
jgi:hypothetical protein